MRAVLKEERARVMSRTAYTIIISLLAGSACLADGLEQRHPLLFGSVSHVLPKEVFKEPGTLARLINPGITEEYRFEETGDAAAVLVVTKIRPDYPKDDSLLDKVVPKNMAMQEHFGTNVVLLTAVSKKSPRVEEMVFLNAEYDQFSFPYGMGGADLTREVESLGISQMFVQEGCLVECAMHFKRKKGEKKAEFVERARAACGKWQRTVKVERSK